MRDLDFVVGEQVIEVKACAREGRVVETLEALVGRSGDAIVRIDVAALQLIDVKAHVLGGLA